MSTEKQKKIKKSVKYTCDVCHENNSTQGVVYEIRCVDDKRDSEHICSPCWRRLLATPAKHENLCKSVDTLKDRVYVLETETEPIGSDGCNMPMLEKQIEKLKKSYKRLLNRMQVLEKK